MRGKARARSSGSPRPRITPAYAGKRARPKTPPLTPRDHPRMCGEKSSRITWKFSCRGSPPRMRGKVYLAACLDLVPVDHPRVCGEKSSMLWVTGCCKGSPPRMRGKDYLRNAVFVLLGITPACAGKRGTACWPCPPRWDHPRMCGEKLMVHPCLRLKLGSPPHVRGKAAAGIMCPVCGGITPAYAGKRLKRSRSTVPPVAIVPLFPSVCNKPVVSDGSPAGRDAPLFLPAENAVPASPAYNLRSL